MAGSDPLWTRSPPGCQKNKRLRNRTQTYTVLFEGMEVERSSDTLEKLFRLLVFWAPFAVQNEGEIRIERNTEELADRSVRDRARDDLAPDAIERDVLLSV